MLISRIRRRLTEQNELFQSCESVSAFAVCGDFTADGLSFVSACQQLMRSTCWGGGHASEPSLRRANIAAEMGLACGSELPGLSQHLKSAPFCCFEGDVFIVLQKRRPRWTRAAVTQRNVTAGPVFPGCTCDSEQSIHVPCPTNVYVSADDANVWMSLWSRYIYKCPRRRQLQGQSSSRAFSVAVSINENGAALTAMLNLQVAASTILQKYAGVPVTRQPQQTRARARNGKCTRC